VRRTEADAWSLHIEGFGGALAPTGTGLIVQTTGSFVPALVVGALIGGVSAACDLFVVDQPITAVDMDATSHPGPKVGRLRHLSSKKHRSMRVEVLKHQKRKALQSFKSRQMQNLIGVI
jgi:hypothetical protein